MGGYTAFEKALFDMSADDIVNEISESNLRGRGGGGFPTGKKWIQVKRQKATPKYIAVSYTHLLAVRLHGREHVRKIRQRIRVMLLDQ